MTRRAHSRVLVGILALGLGGSARAADNAWTNAAANAIWNTTSANWTSPTVWNNANVDSAIFGAVGAGPVAVATPVTARGLQFNATGYSLTGSTITLASGGGGSLAVGEVEVTTGVTTIDNVIAGTVGLTKSGTGRLALSSANIYTGATTISGGVLQLQGGGNVPGNVTNNAVLRFANSTPTAFVGNISGSGEVSLISAGTVTLTGAASHTGGTNIASTATLQVGAGGTAGSLAGDVDNDGALGFNRSDVLTYAGNVTGAGVLQKQGAGSLRITGNLSHTGGTTVSGGTLQIGVAGTAGSISGNITNNGFVAFNRTDAVTYGGVISGTGIMSHSGNNVLTFTGNHTYTGETRTDAGSILQLGNGGTTGGIQATAGNPATIVTNGVVRFNRSDSVTFVGSSVGTGSIEKQGTGTLNLIGDYAHTGGTTISAGIVTLGTGATTGTLAGNITNNALFIFQNSAATTYAGTLTGTGTVSQNGSTLVTITGALNHTGPTNVGGSGGLSIGNGGTAGSIFANVNVSSFIRFNRSDVLTYAGNVTGAGVLQKQGAGSLRITGNLSHTGGTTVSGGTLQIGVAGTAGSISGNITNNGFVAFNRTDAVTYGGVISGTGIMSHSGNNVLTFTGNHTYTGETRTDAGSILQLGNGGTTGGIQATAGNPATIVTNGVVRFNRSDSVTFVGSSVGTGSIEKQGTGTLNLIGDYAHTGGTTISAGIVTLGTGATTGTLAGNITNNALFIFQNSAATTYAGTLTGTGTVSQNGSTLVTITGALNHTGPTNVGGSGGLSIGNGGTAGSIFANVNVSSFIRFNRSDVLTYAGNVTGAGVLQKQGAGSLRITGNLSHTGGTTVSGGTLQIGVAGTAGSISGNITNNGFVAFNRTDAVTYGGVISGTGIMSHSGNNVLTFTGNHTYTGETRTDAGSILQLGNGGTTGGIQATAGNPATIVTNGVVRFNRSDSVTFVGSSVGTGSIEKQGTGTLNLIGDYAHTGGTTISAGIVTLGTGATTGTLAGNITNNALFIFQNSAATTYAGTLTGTGTVSQNGSTLVTITGALNHTGPTNVGGSGGLSIGNGGTAGSIFANVNVSSFIRFNRSNALAYGGVIGGSGDVQKNGGGTLTFNTAHTYNGTTNINAGTLTLTGNGSLANSETIVVSPSATFNVNGVTGGANFSGGRFALASGQTLRGTGTVVGDLGVRNGATLAAGGSPGTTSVTGDVDFDPGSTLGIQLAGATDANAHRSRLSLTGALTFAGSLLNPLEIDVTSFGSFTGGAAATYTIASAGSIGSTGLDTPLNVTLGAGGSGSAINVSLIRLSVSGFEAGDQFTLQRMGNELKLSFLPAANFLEADFDEDHSVDGDDLSQRWKPGYGVGDSHGEGDADGDLDVDGHDFLVWQRQLGGTSATAAGGAVPEPGGLPATICAVWTIFAGRSAFSSPRRRRLCSSAAMHDAGLT